jgi:hypothetical protein
MSRRISRAARRFLLTGQPEPEAYGHTIAGRPAGGCWGILTDAGGRQTVHFFQSRNIRSVWLALPSAANAPFSIASTGRAAVGKRHPLVKALRWHVERGSMSTPECSR